MDFGSALQDGVEQLRAHALSAMTDTVLVDRVIGEVMDPVSLHMVPQRGTVHNGPGKVRRVGLQDQAAVAGDLSVAVDAWLVDLPYDTTGVERGDTVTITTAVRSPGLQGWEFTVAEVTPRPFEVTLTVKRVVPDGDASA